MASMKNANGRHSNEDDEHTALLGSTTTPVPVAKYKDGDDECDSHSTAEEKPLPMGQIFLLLFARLIDPIAYFSIFPYVSQMVYETGEIDQADVGFYTGLIESMFSLVQMMSMFVWGRLADHYGRKGILIICIAGVSLPTAAFGFSRTIWQMVLFRCIAGAMSGNALTVRSMISEHSTRKTQARAFSYYGSSYSLGVLAGPLIGGGLANPVSEYPSIFGSVQLFRAYPYALPSLLCGLFGLTSAIITYLYAEETLTPELRASLANTPGHQMNTKTLMKVSGVKPVIFSYAMFMLIGSAFTAVLPVISFTPISLGGFSFSPRIIALCLAGSAILQSFWILLAFPPLQRRIGTIRVLQLCTFLWLFVFACAPLCNVLLRSGHAGSFWVLIFLSNIASGGACMGYVGIQLTLNDISPSPLTLGMLNATALALAAGTRAFTPGLFNSILAVGLRHQIARGYLVWFVFMLMAGVMMWSTKLLPEKVSGRVKVVPKSRGV